MAFMFNYTLINNKTINAIPIVIDSISNDNDNNVKSPKLGGTKFNVCSTCNLTKENGDMGHPGKTPLKGDIALIKPGCIKNVLEMLNYLKMCNNCYMMRNNLEISNIIAKYDYEFTANFKKDILKILKTNKQNSSSKCNNPNCNNIIGTYKYNFKKGHFFIKKQKDEVLSNSIIFNMLMSVPTQIYKAITPNYSYSYLEPYEAFYKESILIMVLPARPPNYFDNKESHVMTTKLGQLVGTIIKYKNEEELQKIYNDIDHIKPKSPYKTSNMLVTLNIQVAGNKKESIPRSHIMARRADNTARCVAGPSMDRIGYIKVPSIIASTLTSAIYYNRFTEKIVQDLLINNTSIVKYILLYNYENLKPTILLKVKQDSKINNLLKMRYGDRIEIELQNDDIILFSRQPSLHKFNIQAGITRIWEHNTIATPTPIANSLNLDFDGDEMNLYKPKSPGYIEAFFTMFSVNIVKNNYNFSPTFGLIQDQLIVIHMLYNVKEIDLNSVIYILGNYSYLIRDLNKKQYNGNELLSLLFPDNLSYDGIFNNGNLILENINSKYLVAQSYDSFANIISQLKNNVFAVNIIDILLNVARNFISLYSFSVSLSDIIPDVCFVNELQIKINNYCKVIQYVMSKYYNNDKQIIRLTFDELENVRISNCNEILKRIKEKIINKFDSEVLNSIISMKNAGYKITFDELVTVLGCTGQQGIDSNDIPKPATMARVFESVFPSSTDPESLGFVKSSTIKGLTFRELGFHCKYNSMKKILRITCETSSAGSIGRKLVKFMEGAKVDHLGRVVLNNDIIWFNTNYIKMLGADISKIEILLPNVDMENYELISILYNNNKKYLISNFCTHINKEWIFPINIKLKIQSFYSEKYSDMSNNEKLKLIDEFTEDILLNIFFYNIDMVWFKYILLTYLDKYTLTRFNKQHSKELIEYIFKEIKLKLNNSLSPGYAIGLEYANNIQEKFTQQSLSSFHTTRKSGTASVQLGFTDFKDTVELSRKNKQDLITAYSIHKSKLELIKMQVEYLTIKHFDPEITILEETDSEMVISTKILKYYISDKITIFQYYNMFVDFLEKNTVIKGYWITPKLDDSNYVDIVFGIKLREPFAINKIYILKSIPIAVSKGKISNTNLEIETISMYDNELNSNTGYRLKFYLDSVIDFINFDTEEVYLELGPWFSYLSLGIQFAEYFICNRLISTTKEPSMEICYIILSKMMCLTSEMNNIKRLRDGKQNVIKSAIHGNADAITSAAFNNSIDSGTDTYSQILANQIMKIGHGYYECYLNINKYDIIKVKSTEEYDENVKSEIIDLF